MWGCATATGNLRDEVRDVPTVYPPSLAGAYRLPVLDCGTTFHPGFGGRDFPSILLDNLWKLISLATEAPSDSLTYRRYINNCIYHRSMKVHPTRATGGAQPCRDYNALMCAWHAKLLCNTSILDYSCLSLFAPSRLLYRHKCLLCLLIVTPADLAHLA